MDMGTANVLPWVLGAGAVTVSGIVAVLRGYKWFIAQIREAIAEAMRSHETGEMEWRLAIEKRLDRLEAKVDRLIEGRK